MNSRKLVFALAALFLRAAPASAETTLCTSITTLPYTISSSGIYCLTGDLTTSMSSGAAITIAANSVTLDLNGHKLGGSAAGLGTTAVGIYAVDRQNLVIMNGTVRGFYYGIQLVDFTGTYSASIANLVQDITAEAKRYSAIRVECRGCTLRRNHVLNGGGTTANGVNSSGAGLSVFGDGNAVLKNDVSNIVGTGSGPGYGLIENAS